MQRPCHLGLSIDYDRIIKIETAIANSVTDIINKNNGVYVPHTKQYISRSIIQIFTMIHLTAKASFMAQGKYYFKRQIAKQKHLRNLKLPDLIKKQQTIPYCRIFSWFRWYLWMWSIIAIQKSGSNLGNLPGKNLVLSHLFSIQHKLNCFESLAYILWGWN